MERIAFDVPSYSFGGPGGPSVAITAGIHGNEQTGIHTAMLLCRALESARLRGRATVIPFCNIEASKAVHRQAPADGLDLNRIFPGDPAGSYSQQLAHHIWGMTEGYDYLLDLHCCGINGSTYGMSYYSRHDWAERLLDSLMLRTVVHTKGTRGQLYIEAAELRGQKSLLIELPGGQPGGAIRLDAAEECARGVMNYLIHIGVMDGAEIPFGQVRLCSCFLDFGDADRDGLFQPWVHPGDTVQKGQTLGLLDGTAVAAPCDGVATRVSPSRYAFRGQELLRISELRRVQPGEVPLPPLEKPGA